jgi:hypothetical protein
MIVKVAAKDVRRKCVALFVCLFVAANSVQGTVLCFGADGHVEFESAFHEQCTGHDHSWLPYQSHDSSEAEHEGDRDCHNGLCVDVLVDVGLTRISKTTEQSDRAFDAAGTDVIVVVDQADYSVHCPVSNAFFDTSYFDPLRTIILLA